MSLGTTQTTRGGPRGMAVGGGLTTTPMVAAPRWRAPTSTPPTSATASTPPSRPACAWPAIHYRMRLYSPGSRPTRHLMTRRPRPNATPSGSSWRAAPCTCPTGSRSAFLSPFANELLAPSLTIRTIRSGTDVACPVLGAPSARPVVYT